MAKARGTLPATGLALPVFMSQPSHSLLLYARCYLCPITATILISRASGTASTITATAQSLLMAHPLLLLHTLCSFCALTATGHAACVTAGIASWLYLAAAHGAAGGLIACK
eukprot:scaffold203828_cov26-Tisochrysis_lutea.AAC.1